MGSGQKTGGAVRVLILSALILLWPLALPAPVSAYVERDIILIDSNSGLTAENGVTSGTGTQEDPFVIEGWSIIPRTPDDSPYANSPIAMIIGETTAHLIIRNLEINPDADLAIGISIHDSENIVIEDISIRAGTLHFYRCHDIKVTGNTFLNGGISGYECYDIEISYNTLSTDWWNSINLDDSHDIVIRGNSINGGQILLEGVSYTVIEDNALNVNGEGIHATDFKGLTIARNSFSDQGMFLVSSDVEDYRSCDIAGNNLIGGRPLLIYRDQSDVTISDSSVSQGILIDCTNVRIADATFDSSPVGLIAVGVSGLTIESSIFKNCTYGAIIGGCDGVEVSYSDFFSNPDEGIAIWNSSHGIIHRNIFWKNGERGMWHGLPGGSGLALTGCEHFSIYNNDFVANGRSAYSKDCNQISWDAGYELKGNYWAGYVSPDRMAGPGQSVPSPDGVVDIPMEITYEGEQDNYPVLDPFRYVSLEPEPPPSDEAEGLSLSESVCLSTTVVVLSIILFLPPIMRRRGARWRPEE